eukprot:scaffold40082_cov55-Attheya_sp.AAC.2
MSVDRIAKQAEGETRQDSRTSTVSRASRSHGESANVHGLIRHEAHDDPRKKEDWRKISCIFHPLAWGR